LRGKHRAEVVFNSEFEAGQRGAYFDAFILKSGLWGMGIDLRELLKTWKQKRI
jgi:hypothetical protein